MNAGTGRFGSRLAVIAVAAFALRLAIRAVAGTDTYWTDGYSHYLTLAKSIGAGMGYSLPGQGPTAFRVPGYPVFVWVVTGGGQPNVWALITAQAAVSAGTCVLAGLAARGMAGPRAGLIAAALYAAWPYAAWHDVSLQESGLFAFLTMGANLAMLNARTAAGAAGAGAIAGLALLTRATLIGWLAGTLVWLALKRGWGAALAAGLAAALLLAPWAERQHRLTGSWGLGTESGAALYAGNHPLTFSAYPAGSIDESRTRIFLALPPADRARLAAMDEAGRDRWYRARGMEAIAADPAAFAQGALRKIGAAFGPWPSPRKGGFADFAYMLGWVPFALLGLAGMGLRWRQWRADFPLLWHFPAFIATTAVFWSHTAHRSFLDPIIAVYAGIALAAMVGRFRSKAS